MENFQKAFNDDIEFSGIFLKQYPKEEEWYKELASKLIKFKRGDPVKNIINIRKDVMHPRDYEHIVNNFVILYNQNEKPVMRLVRDGENEKNIINKVIVDYKVNFFVEFPNRESYYAYEISVNIQRNASSSQKFNFENSIVNVELKGGSGLSDVKYGVPNDLNNKNNIKFYKDTNEYGEYLFMYNDDEVKQILSERSGKVDESIKGVPVGTSRNIISNRPQRNAPVEQPKYVPTKVYTQPVKTTGKLQIGNQCMRVDELSDKIVASNCEEGSEFVYSGDNIKYKNKCVSFHANGNIELLGCDNLNACKPNESLNNCMNFKFIQYGGLDIDGNNSCLNPSQKTFIAEPCDMSGKANII